MDIISTLRPHLTDERYERLLEVIENRTNHITVVLEDVYQPHNASAVLRSCDCFGIQDVHIVENKHNYTVSDQVALGSHKWLNLHRYSEKKFNTLDCIDNLKSKGYRVVGTSPHAKDGSLEELDISTPTAIILGTEGPGMTQEAMDACDACIKIPMFGFTESFNLSVSAAIILHHLSWKLRQSNDKWQLSPEEKKSLLGEMMKRSIRESEKILERASGQDK